LSDADRIVERLKRGFASLEENGPAAGGDCPSPDTIWDAVHQALEPREARAVAQHLAECPGCAADWRVAMQSGEESASVAPASAPQRSPRRWALAGAAAAALLVVGGIAAYEIAGRLERSAPTYRAPAGEEIRSLLPDEALLPRDRAVLRWTPVGSGTLYSGEIGRPDLTPLDVGYDLEEAEYRIPPAALEPVEPGGTVVWQVEASLPDGRRILSEAFLATIE